ncbi:hypothetical protein NC653_031581 [Populus alba x Populus x berolinensis]|uniref:Uncharacterized protein n=1 Tax=Populus alba x Populus x berolinensis TaxID=444605 RepID=A0AAD6LZ40_9ROSI|nr:hypothetical protein NC653_031581 [Populus alba x Populus x berolinensis]
MYSWVTMKDGVHVFVAGDNSHPEKRFKQGRTPELSQEKLAVVFVLTRNSGLPIRIMKNLRVYVIQTGFITLRMVSVHVRITGDWPASLVSRNIGIIDR